MKPNFYIVSDIITCWVLPALLGYLGAGAIWLYTHCGVFADIHVISWQYEVSVLVGIAIWAISLAIGAGSMYFRETPSDLAEYCKGFVKLVIQIELALMLIHLVGYLLLQFLQLGYILHFTMICMGLGLLILYHASNRMFLSISPFTMEPSHLRGRDLEHGQHIAWRAWEDE